MGVYADYLRIAQEVLCLEPPPHRILTTNIEPTGRLLRSGMPDSARNSASGPWSRNLRAFGRYSTDSGSSGTRSPAHPNSQFLALSSNGPATISEDARLLKQIDLAARRDEAVYKPNPWSIARMNAATRPQPRKDKSAVDQVNLQPKKQPKGHIVEGFHRRLEKTQARATPVAPKEKTLPSGRSTIASHTAKSRDMREPPHLISSKRTNAHYISSGPMASASSHASLSSRAPPYNATASQASGYTARAQAIPERLSPSVGNYYQHIIGGKSSDRPLGLHSSCHPALGLDQIHNSGAEEGTAFTRPRHKFLQPLRHTFHRDIMSSPIHAPMEASPSHSHIIPHAVSSPLRAPSDHNRNVFDSPRTRPFKSLTSWNPQDYRMEMSRVLGPHDRSSTPAVHGHAPAASPSRWPRRLTPPRSSSPDRSSLTQMSKHGVECEGDPYNLVSSPESAWSTLPAKKNVRKSKRTGQPSNITSSKFRLPLATSTLAEPEAKRRRVSYLPPPPQESAFRKTPSTDAANERPAVWKVTRILPGQIPEKLVCESRSAAPSTIRGHPDQERDLFVHKEPRNSHNQISSGYPSPPHRPSSPTQHSMSLASFELGTAVSSAAIRSFSTTSNDSSGRPTRYMPGRNVLPSPPRSDSPSELSSDANQLRLPFSTRTLEDRYPKMRKAVAERKRAIAGVWDVLELPSCGTIYQSPQGSPTNPHSQTQRTREELPIVRWEGRHTRGC